MTNVFQRFSLCFRALFFAATVFVACQKSPRHVSTAFYFWKTAATMSDFEKKYAADAKTQRLFVRLFDVDFDEAARFPKPVGAVSSFSKFKNAGFDITPTVFLTNKTFTQLGENQIDTLAVLVFEKIKEITVERSEIPKHFGKGSIFREIQMDCDWTATTRDRYFAFLNALKKRLPDGVILSATIRLHQIKFSEKTGIPPVERGMLMAYNMENLDDVKTDNSILNVETLKTYSTRLSKYPLPLDVALPIFSWGVVFRDGQAVQLINNLFENELEATPQYFFKKKEDRFEILKNTYLHGSYFYRDDEIRLEQVPLSNLQLAAEFLSQNIGNQSFTIVFFSLDSAAMQRFLPKDLENVVNQFR